VHSNCVPRKPAAAGEFIIEVIGADGLRHHVGPFRQREDAENWIAQNPSDCDSEIPHGSGDNSARNRGRRLTD
jgi:hypothetical protein